MRQVSNAASVIDPALLKQEAAANVGKGVAGQPTWSQLSNFLQLLVEIDFENDSVAIEPKSYRTIGPVADALHHPNLMFYKFLVVGHWRSQAQPEAEPGTRRRAQALATTFAIAPDRLYSVGVGQEMPVDAANMKAAANSRVQLINLGRLR